MGVDWSRSQCKIWQWIGEGVNVKYGNESVKEPLYNMGVNELTSQSIILDGMSEVANVKCGSELLK